MPGDEQVIAALGKAGGLAALVAEAHGRIAGSAVLRTPLLESDWLASAVGAAGAWVKLESEQRTGSFKLRGATNKLLSMAPSELARGVITSSTGNHGAGVLAACRYLNRRHGAGLPPPLKPQIWVPETIGPHKLQRLEAMGAHVVQVGQDCVEAEVAAAAAARESGAVYISPYNDLQVMAGQGTAGVEILVDLAAGLPAGEPDAAPDVVFIPVGGGGLISGIAAVLKAWSPSTHIVGCQPAASAIMAASVKAGRILDLPSLPTLSDGTAGGVEADALTLQPCTELVDEWVLVEEADIAAAMRAMLRNHSKLVEGAAGCALAGCLQLGCQRLAGKRVVVVACGGNVSVDVLRQVLNADD